MARRGARRRPTADIARTPSIEEESGNDQNTSEQQRRQRADLVTAFSRRAWQPSERPQVGPRLLAGGAALIIVAGGAFAVGALT